MMIIPRLPDISLYPVKSILELYSLYCKGPSKKFSPNSI
uniref:Uncharacterized protein n=1 Tax=Anguilla anguilla TaxID=7936 RepID=A0A0E9XQQ9_ANGAN